MGAEDLTVQPCNHHAKGWRAGSTWRNQTAVSRGKGKTGALLGKDMAGFWLLSSRKRPLHGSANVKGTHIDLSWPIRSGQPITVTKSCCVETSQAQDTYDPYGTQEIGCSLSKPCVLRVEREHQGK